MLTKKDFRAFALALHSERPGDNWDPNKRVQWLLDTKAIARVLATSNPAFDKDRFFRCVETGRDAK